MRVFLLPALLLALFASIVLSAPSPQTKTIRRSHGGAVPNVARSQLSPSRPLTNRELLSNGFTPRSPAGYNSRPRRSSSNTSPYKSKPSLIYVPPSSNNGGSYGNPPSNSGGSYGQPPSNNGGSYGQPPSNSGGSYGKPPSNNGGSYGQPPSNSGSYGNSKSGSGYQGSQPQSHEYPGSSNQGSSYNSGHNEQPSSYDHESGSKSNDKPSYVSESNGYNSKEGSYGSESNGKSSYGSGSNGHSSNEGSYGSGSNGKSSYGSGSNGHSSNEGSYGSESTGKSSYGSESNGHSSNEGSYESKSNSKPSYVSESNGYNSNEGSYGSDSNGKSSYGSESSGHSSNEGSYGSGSNGKSSYGSESSGHSSNEGSYGSNSNSKSSYGSPSEERPSDKSGSSSGESKPKSGYYIRRSDLVGNIMVHTSAGPIGFVSSQLTEWNTFAMTTDAASAEVVTMPAVGARDFSILAASQAAPNFGAVHGYDGPADNPAPVYASFAPTQGTTGAPAKDVNNPTGQPSEADVWNLDASTMELTARWGLDSGEYSNTMTLFLDKNYGDLNMAQDLDKFTAYYGDATEEVQFFFVPL